MNVAKLTEKPKIMTDRITHSGIVDEVDGDTVSVRILQTSACSGCKVSGHCNASESKVKTIVVRRAKNASRWSVGDAVTVSASTSVAFRALLLSFGVPFAVMVVVLLVTLLSTGSETVSGVVALASLLPYYGLLYLMRNRVSRGVEFTIDD